MSPVAAVEPVREEPVIEDQVVTASEPTSTPVLDQPVEKAPEPEVEMKIAEVSEPVQPKASVEKVSTHAAFFPGDLKT